MLQPWGLLANFLFFHLVHRMMEVNGVSYWGSLLNLGVPGPDLFVSTDFSIDFHHSYNAVLQYTQVFWSLCTVLGEARTPVYHHRFKIFVCNCHGTDSPLKDNIITCRVEFITKYNLQKIIAHCC